MDVKSRNDVVKFLMEQNNLLIGLCLTRHNIGTNRTKRISLRERILQRYSKYRRRFIRSVHLPCCHCIRKPALSPVSSTVFENMEKNIYRIWIVKLSLWPLGAISPARTILSCKCYSRYRILLPWTFSFPLRPPLSVQAAFLPPFSFLVRMTDSGKKGCQPAGQIFIVITSRKGIFPAWSPAECASEYPWIHKRIFVLEPRDRIVFLLHRKLRAASDWFSNWQSWTRPFGIITLCIVLLLIDPFQNDSPSLREYQKIYWFWNILWKTLRIEKIQYL